MAVTNYYSMDGMIFAESTNGVMRNYGTDALGSVVETIVNGAVENTYQYKPYGGLLAKTGTAPDPTFLWNGGSGYRATKLVNSDYYFRRRTLSSSTGSWSSVGSRWTVEPAYIYEHGNPTSGNNAFTASFYLERANRKGYNRINCDSGGCCGCSWTWDLTQGGRPLSDGVYGWIVQKVYTEQQVWIGCNIGTKLTKNTFYEAWEVVAGVVHCGPSSSPSPGGDFQGFSTPFPIDCVKRHLAVRTVAAFYLNASLDASFHLSPWEDTGECKPMCSQLLENDGLEPAFWNRPNSNSPSGSWSIDYTCCTFRDPQKCAGMIAGYKMSCKALC